MSKNIFTTREINYSWAPYCMFSVTLKCKWILNYVLWTLSEVGIRLFENSKHSKVVLSNNQSFSSIKRPSALTDIHFWYFYMVLAASINSYPPLMLLYTVSGASETEALSLAIVIFQLSLVVNNTPKTWSCIGLCSSEEDHILCKLD